MKIVERNINYLRQADMLLMSGNGEDLKESPIESGRNEATIDLQLNISDSSVQLRK